MRIVTAAPVSDWNQTPAAAPLTTLRLHPDKTRAGMILVFSLLLVAFGFKVIAMGDPAGWFILVIFSLSTLTCLSVLLPGACFLEVTTEGVTIASCFRRKLYRWDQIERMGIFRIGMVQRVGVDLNARYRGPERVPNYAKSASGYHVSLPPMTGMELEELLDLMQECHRVCLQPATTETAGTRPPT